MEEPDQIEQLAQIAPFYKKNPVLLKDLTKLGVNKKHDILYKVFRNRRLFTKYSHMEVKKYGKITEALECKARDKVIVYFADIGLYAVFTGLPEYSLLRAAIQDAGAEEFTDIGGETEKHDDEGTAEIGKLLVSQTTIFDRKMMFASCVHSTEQAQRHIDEFDVFCEKIRRDLDRKHIGDIDQRLCSGLKHAKSLQNKEICQKNVVIGPNKNFTGVSQPVCNNVARAPAGRKMGGAAPFVGLLDWDTAPGGSVYFIVGDPFGGYVKIGRSQNPAGRLKQLQTGCPVDLVLRAAIPVDDCVVFERTLHSICRDLRVRGEWFVMTESELVALISAW